MDKLRLISRMPHRIVRIFICCAFVTLLMPKPGNCQSTPVGEKNWYTAYMDKAEKERKLAIQGKPKQYFV